MGYVSDSRKPKKSMELSFIGSSNSNKATSAYCTGTQNSESEENILVAPSEVHNGISIQMKKEFQVEVSSAHRQ